MISPFPATQDRALLEWTRQLPFRDGSRHGRGFLGAPMPPVDPLLDAPGAPRSLLVMAVSVCLRLAARALDALPFPAPTLLRTARDSARDRAGRLALMAAGGTLGLDCYRRLACLWTRSLCAELLELGALGAPALDSPAKPGAPDPTLPAAPWRRGLPRAWMAPADFADLDRAFALCALPLGWSPGPGLPPYALLRRACSRLCLEPGWGCGGFEGAAAAGDRIGALWEASALADCCPPAARPPSPAPRRI